MYSVGGVRPHPLVSEVLEEFLLGFSCEKHCSRIVCTIYILISIFSVETKSMWTIREEYGVTKGIALLFRESYSIISTVEAAYAYRNNRNNSKIKYALITQVDLL